MNNKPLLYAIGAFSIWGLLPLYLKQLQSFSPYEITAYRIIFSFITLFFFLGLSKGFKNVIKKILSHISNPLLIICSLLIGVNWFFFVYCIDKNIILEASFGYFSGPLVSISLGLLFLKEKASKLKLVAIALAIVSVLIQAFDIGYVPLTSIILAFSFALYGLVKKFINVAALDSLLIESLILFVPSTFYIFYIESTVGGSILGATGTEYVFVLLSGVVTIAPLLFFTKAATSLPLNVLGFLQYLAPMIQFFIAYFIYKEDLSNAKAISFFIIWVCCMIIMFDQKRSKA